MTLKRALDIFRVAVVSAVNLQFLRPAAWPETTIGIDRLDVANPSSEGLISYRKIPGDRCR